MLRSLISLLIVASLNTGTSLPETLVASDISEALISSAALVSAPPPVEALFDGIDLLTASLIPVKKEGVIEPLIEAKAALIMDFDSGSLLYAKNIHEQLPMASLTKIMVAVLILESHDLDEVVSIEDNFNGLLGVRIWLKQNEEITVGNLLIGLLVRSGGDAALALAKYHSGSVEAFMAAMNQKATILNLKNTHFINPIGLDADGHFSSAFDLAILTKYALHNADFRKIIQMPNALIKSTNGKIVHSFNNTNLLLKSYLNILGVKTGTTDAAGASVINLARNDTDNEVIAVLLNSPSRFQENKSMIDWVFRNHTW